MSVIVRRHSPSSLQAAHRGPKQYCEFLLFVNGELRLIVVVPMNRGLLQ
jgi:hypothetical protein